ncbi:MAG: hypothetical protein ACKVHE_01350 [Planctomycetales bacterium]
MNSLRFSVLTQLRLRPVAGCFVQMLHRILHRFTEVIVGHLQVMLGCDLFAVSEPVTDDMRGERFRQFCLACAP